MTTAVAIVKLYLTVQTVDSPSSPPSTTRWWSLRPALSGRPRAACTRPPRPCRNKSAIEARFGVALFEKVGRGIRPSAAGEALLGSLTRLFDEAASLEAQLGEMTAARVTTLRIAASDYLGEAILLPVLRRLFDEAAPLRFEITTTNSIEAGRLASAGQVDVAVVSTDRALTPDETQLCTQRFFWWRPGRARSAPPPSRCEAASPARRCCACAPEVRGDACSTSASGASGCGRCRQ